MNKVKFEIGQLYKFPKSWEGTAFEYVGLKDGELCFNPKFIYYRKNRTKLGNYKPEPFRFTVAGLQKLIPVSKIEKELMYK
jgi:hypothetical protein